MRTRWFHDQLQRRVVQNLEELTGARASLGKLKVQPFAFQFALSDLVLHGTEPASQPPLFYAKRIVLRVNPLSVLQRHLLISSLYGSGLEIHLQTHRDGSTNLHGPHTEKSSSPANELMNLRVGTLSIGDSNLFWNNQKIPLEFAAKKVALLLYYDGRQGYSGSFSSSPLRFSARGRALPPLTLATHLKLSAQGLDLQDLAWRSPDIFGNGVLHIAWKQAIEGQATLQARGDLAQLGRTVKLPLFREGHFQLSCQAAYRGGEFSVQGNIQSRGVEIRSGPLASAGRIDAKSDFSASPSRINLTHLSIVALGGTLEGEGGVRLLRVPEFTVRLRLHGLGLAQSLAMVKEGSEFEHLVPLAAAADGKLEASWRGSFQGFKSDFDLQLTPPGNIPSGSLPLQGFARGAVSASPSLVLSLDQAQFGTLHSQLSAEGGLGPGQTGLQLRYSTTQITETDLLLEHIAGFSKPIPIQLKSPAIFTGKITGSLLHAEIQGQLSLGAFSYSGWAWSGLTAGISASPESLRIDSGRLHSESSTLNFSGSAGLEGWQVAPHSPLSLTARASRAPLRGLEEAFGVHYPVTGLASGRLQLTGTPTNLAGSGSFDIEKGAIEREPVDHVSGQVRIGNSVWDFENLLLEKGTGKVTGVARFDLPHRSFSVELHGDHFSLGQFETLAPRHEEGQPTAAQLSGSAAFSLQGHGTLNRPAFTSTLSFHGMELEGDKLGDLEAHFTLQDEKLEGEGLLKGAAGTLNFKTAVETQGDWSSELSGDFANFHLDPWINWLGHGHLGDHPVATGSFKGAGPLKDLARFSLQADARTLSIETPDFRLANLETVHVRYSNRTLTASRFEMKGPSTNLQLQFSAQFGPPAEFLVEAEGKSDASVLKLLDPSIQAVGSFGINIHASGSLDHPSLSGQIGVENVSVRYGSLLPPLAALHGTISLQGDRATIQSLEGESGQSSIHLAGYMTLGSPSRYNLQVHAQHIRMAYPSDFTSILSGELHLTGSASAGELTGDITVDQMYVSPDFNFVTWLGQTGPSLVAPSGAASNIRLNIHVASNPEIRIASRTLSFTGAIDVTLRGTLTNPVATGDIRLDNGQALVAGNRYTITRGDIALTNPFQTNPVLDIEAQTRVQRYNLTIDVTGPIDHAKLAYRSDPPLPTEDILSLLALGYAPQQTLMTASGNQSFGAVGASALLSQALSTQVSGRVQQIFGVSRIRIDPNLLGPTTAGGARITIEEQVAHNLTITYSTNTAAAEQRDIRLRWDISDKISLIGERDINGVFGVEIRFHRRLR